MKDNIEKISKEHVPQPVKLNEEKFFKDVEEVTKKTLEKEHRQEQYKANISKVSWLFFFKEVYMKTCFLLKLVYAPSEFV